VLEESLTTRSSREKYDQVVALCERAIALDPRFGLAHARLTGVHGTMYFLAALDPTLARRELARTALQNAQRLAPDAPETRAALGTFIYYCDNDWAKGLEEMHAAEASLPNDAQLIARMGFASRRLGRIADAIAFMERAAALNPHDLYVGTQLVQTYFMARRFSEALARAKGYVQRFPEETYMRDWELRAQFSLDGDRAAYLRVRAALPPLDNDPQGRRKPYENAMLAADFPAAARALENPGIVTVPNSDSSITDPVALHRAYVAFLRGDSAAARKFADEAIQVYRDGQWNPRQEPFVLIGRARAAAFAGRAADAQRDAEAAWQRVVGRDAFASSTVLFEVARVYASLGERAKAFQTLRQLLGGISYFAPAEIRFEPILSRLKDDPQFEEILREAKPL
jgi:tetratricopeptide (TPR) repeat protein